jgi:protein TonB
MGTDWQKMKTPHLIFIASACLALSGCTTEQSANHTPGAIINPADVPVVQPASVNPEDMLPKLIHGANPVYPNEVQKEGIVGVVTVRFVVDTDGNVVSPVVMKSPDPRLSQAVLDAIAQWKFLPGEKNGRKVNTQLEMPLTFSLDR